MSFRISPDEFVRICIFSGTFAIVCLIGYISIGAFYCAFPNVRPLLALFYSWGSCSPVPQVQKEEEFSQPNVSPDTSSSFFSLSQATVFTDREERAGIIFDVDKICQSSGKQIPYAATYRSRLIVGEMYFNQNCSPQQISSGKYQALHFTTGTGNYFLCSGTVTYFGQRNVLKWELDNDSLARGCNPQSYEKSLDKL